MSYQSSDAKKEEFRKYLESNQVIDALTRVLVNLYEENDKPDDPVEYIKKVLGGASSADYEALQQENARLRVEVETLKNRVNELQKLRSEEISRQDNLNQLEEKENKYLEKNNLAT